jgi:hypothetical protein
MRIVSDLDERCVGSLLAHSVAGLEKSPIDNARLESLKNLAAQFEERKARASERLAHSVGKHWSFALLGMHTSVEHFSFSKIGELRSVIEPPGEIELARALKDQHLFGAIGRYSQGITHELAINRDFAESDQTAFNIGWWIISAIRVKTLAEFLVPAVADHSWSIIAALDQQQCHAQLIEDAPQARRVDDPVMIQEADLQWVLHRILQFGEMLEVPRFQLAVEALTTHQHLVSPRMMAASLWSGIEALLGIQAELRFRIALSVASLLEPRGQLRAERYRRVKKLYDVRSRAVHGAAMNETDLISHVAEARKLLSSMVCTMVESGKVLSEEEIEGIVLN